MTKTRNTTKAPRKPKGAWRAAKRVTLYMPPEWWRYLLAESGRRKQMSRPDYDYTSIAIDGLRLLKAGK